MKLESNKTMNGSSKYNIKKIYAGSFYTFFVNGIIALILGAILPYIRETYGLSYRVSGLLISFHSVGNLISSYFGGVLPLHIGKRKSIVMFSSFGVIAFVLMIISGNPIALILAFSMTGLTRGAVSNFNNSVINEIATGKGWTLNLLHSIFAIGAFIAPFLAMLFTRNNTEGWMYAVFIVIILCILEVVVFGVMPIPNENVNNNKTKSDKRAKTKTDWGFLKNKYYLTACGIMFSYMCAEQAVNGWLVTYFKDSGIMSGSLAQIMSSLLWLVILCGRLLYGYLSNHIEKSKILLAGSIGYLIFFIILLLARTTSPVVVGIIGIGFFMSGIYPTTIASVGHIIKDYPMALSIMLVITGFGAIIMPSIIGAVADSIGIVGGMSVVIVAVVVTVLFIAYNRYIYRNVNEV